ncbi:MAG: hypothetical protein ACRDJV_03095 [Actinomycetota bacterium]
MRKIYNEKGVAMVTVLFVAAVLTVVSSAGAFITINELRAGTNDRRGTEALAYAESGVDRMALEIKKHSWRRLNESGCLYEPIAVPEGNLGAERFYNAYLTVYDPDLPEDQRLPNLNGWEPGDPWSTGNDSTALCLSHDNVHPETGARFALTAVGEHPTASRVIRQVVRVKASGLPIGLYADSVNVQGGNPSTLDISLVTPGDVQGREKLEFTGYDPYYKLGHFWAGESMSIAAPAAAHARGTIYCSKQTCGNDQKEHPTALECRPNPGGQSQWDQSGGGGSLGGFAKCAAWAGTPAGPPPYSSFSDADLARARPQPQFTNQEYAYIKRIAQTSGLYCAMGDNGSGTCTKPSGGFSTNGTIQDADITGLPNLFFAYFEFPNSGDPFSVKRTITWKAGVGPCSDDPNVHRNVIIVVRYGSIDLTGKDEIVGAFFAPEGQAWLRGSGGIVKIHGTVIAKKIDFGGNAEVMLSDCWVRNMPLILTRVIPETWSEVDR